MIVYALVRLCALVFASTATAGPPDVDTRFPDEVPSQELHADTCVADTNHDGNLSILDFILFHDLFAAGSLEADLNHDGTLDLLDVVVFQAAYAEGCDEAFGWTEFVASPDTRIVYVSSSGDDANDGLSPESPVRSLEHACTLVRDGFPDWLLLRRGDAWIDEHFGRWKKSGRSAAEPLLIGAYGNGVQRPRVLTGSETRGIWLDGASGLKHVAFVGIELFAHTYDGATGAEAGILWLGGGQDVLIEDCFIHGYKDNIVFNGFNDVVTDVRVRGCVIADAWSTVAHAQGLYAQEAEDILIERCVLDHNGWREGVAGAEPTVFNHNIYIQWNCSDVDITDCLLIDASSHAIQLRCTGTVTNSLFISNPIGLLVGNGGEDDPADVVATDNVFLFADDIGPNKPRGMGIDLQNVTSGVIAGNIFGQSASAEPFGHALKINATPDAPVSNVEFTANIVHDWPGPLRFNASDITNASITANIFHIEGAEVPLVKHNEHPDEIDVSYSANRYYTDAPDHYWFQIAFDTLTFLEWQPIVDEPDATAGPTVFNDPFRTPQSYQASIGEVASFDAFVEAVRSQGRLTWDARYSTDAVLSYFVAGYAPVP